MKDHEKSIQMIEQDMARSRAEIDRTAEALATKMEPENLAGAARQVIMESTNRVEEKVKELADTATERVEGFSEQAVNYFYQNPVPALMAGLGIGLLISLAEREVSTVSYATEPMSPTASRIDQTLARNPRLMRVQRKTVRGARRANHQHPLILGATVFGVGLLLGSLLPNTRREHEKMGAVRDRLLETGKENAQQVIQQAKSVMEVELDKRKAEAVELKDTVEETAMKAFNDARNESTTNLAEMESTETDIVVASKTDIVVTDNLSTGKTTSKRSLP